MIRVVGFSTLCPKPRGTAGIVYFKDEHVFSTDRVPSENEMRAYATRHGYPLLVKDPGPGLISEQASPACEPVYTYKAHQTMEDKSDG